jgi:hypothetical protein
MMASPRPPAKPTLEELLRLKRAERPAPEFWADFDSRLRHKQLAAIVNRRPWWRVSLTRCGKLLLPVGATAALAFLAVLIFQRTPSSQPASAPASPATSASPSFVALEPSAPATFSMIGNAEALVSQEALTVSAAEPALLAPATITPRELPPSTEAALVEKFPSDSSPTDGVTAVPADMPEASATMLAQLLLGLDGTSSTDDSSVFNAGSILEAVASSAGSLLGNVAIQTASADAGSLSTPNLNSRRARLLASAGLTEGDSFAAENSRVARTRDRIARRLSQSENSLHDSISRLGLEANSVSIKF